MGIFPVEFPTTTADSFESFRVLHYLAFIKEEDVLIDVYKRQIQVLSNLLHNAMKFTASGEIRFGCRLEGMEEVYFFVSDTGIGLSLIHI